LGRGRVGPPPPRGPLRVGQADILPRFPSSERPPPPPCFLGWGFFSRPDLPRNRRRAHPNIPLTKLRRDSLPLWSFRSLGKSFFGPLGGGSGAFLEKFKCRPKEAPSARLLLCCFPGWGAGLFLKTPPFGDPSRIEPLVDPDFPPAHASIRQRPNTTPLPLACPQIVPPTLLFFFVRIHFWKRPQGGSAQSF